MSTANEKQSKAHHEFFSFDCDYMPIDLVDTLDLDIQLGKYKIR
jgi:hypothetical protein